MPVLLAIDTSTQACSAALLHNGELIQELSDEPRSHTRLLLPMVDKVLASADCSLQQLDAIAFTAGPGSFTGLRIGIGVVQGLAFGADIPVIGVSTMQALALGAIRQLQAATGDILVPAFDARMGEIYWGAYRVVEGQLPEALCADSLTAPEKVAEQLQMGQLPIGIGEGWQYAEQFPVTCRDIHCDLLTEAQDVASIALQLYSQGQAVAVEQAELVYLRDTVSWRKRQKLRQ